jgi:hypothetical protein
MIIVLEKSKKGGVELQMEINFIVHCKTKIDMVHKSIFEAFEDFSLKAIDETFEKDKAP